MVVVKRKVIEQKQLHAIFSSIADLKQRSKQLADMIKNLDIPEDMGIKIFVNRVSKMSLQSLDLFYGLERQLGFLNNEYTRKKREDDIKTAKKITEEKRKRRHGGSE